MLFLLKLIITFWGADPHPVLFLLTSFKLEAIPDTLAHALLELCWIIPPQACSLDVSGRLVVWARQHGYDGEENGFGCLDGGPAFGGRFVAVLVFFGRVEDRDADFAVRVDFAVLVGHVARSSMHERWWRGSLLGWKMGVSKRILGGSIGYS